jgi:hypothetical protein
MRSSNSARPVRHGGRGCSRASCRKPAAKTLTYIYSDSTAILGPLATFAEPHSYDLCTEHSEKLTLPNGWTVIKAQTELDQLGGAGPNLDDIMAIADAVREVGAHRAEPEVHAAPTAQELGRRGHLRALPSN